MASYFWTGNDTFDPFDFSDAGNWTPSDGPPQAGDDTTITDDATLNQPVEITQTSEVDNLSIDDGALDDDGLLLTVDNALIVGVTATTNGTSNSLLSVEGIGGEIDAGSLDIGQGSGSNGSVTVNGPGALAATNSIIIGDQGTGYLYLFSGGTVTAGTLFDVGVDGFGDLQIEASVVNVGTGASGDDADFVIGAGDNAGGSGVTSIDGFGAQLNVSRAITVGGFLSNGGNQLLITGGAVVNANLSGDAEAENVTALAVATESSDIQTYGQDTIDIDGPGSALHADGTIVVGVNGMAEIDVADGAQLTGQSYPTGVSALGQGSNATGILDVESGSIYIDDDLKVGDGGTGKLYVVGNSFVGITSDLAIAEQLGSSGTVQVGDSTQSPDTSSLFTGSINVGGDFGGAGGAGMLSVEDDATVGIGAYLNVWGSDQGTGVVDLSNLTGGLVEVGFLPTGETASQFQGDLVLDPSGTLQLENGIIQNGKLYFNGGTFNVTSTQIDDKHNVLEDVGIYGQDLSVTDAVLTLADGTTGYVLGPGDVPDNVLIDATGSLIDLREDLGPYYLSQIVNLTDTALTVDATAPAPNFVIGAGGVINGTGAIFSDYRTPEDGFFSADVNLDNQGLIDAEANDGSLNPDAPGRLSVLTNTITNDPSGTFEADAGATLNIGNSDQPLNANHVFTNLVGNGDGTTSLVDGLYFANGGTIGINGYDTSGFALNPISTLSAVLYLVGQDGVNGDLLVNGTPVEDTLTTVAPSADAGEGDLALFDGDFSFNNIVTVEGLAADAPSSWTINAFAVGGVDSGSANQIGTFGVGTGGLLYLGQGTFSGPGLVIDGATGGGTAAGIEGAGVIDALVTMDGTTTTQESGGGNILEFEDAVIGSGSYVISGSTALWFNQTLGNPGDPASENTITFDDNPNGASLWIGATDVTDGFRATIDDFGPNDDIDLLNVTGASAVLDSIDHQIDVLDGAGHVIATLQVDDTIPDGTTFQTSTFAGGATGTTIRWAAPACYCRGTLIATDRGEVPVEELAIGDRVATRSGTLRPIKWIGKRSYGGRFVIGRDDILPVCIKAGALEDHVPRRDLWISPNHAMYLDGALIEARDLINGLSIVQAKNAELVEYFHVELESHDVLLAEGAWSETFVDDDSRGMFHNAHEFAALYPDAVSGTAQFCAPRCLEGYRVETARRRIERRAGLHGAADRPAGALRGRVETIAAHCIAGWALNVEHPEAPVCLDIFSAGRLIGQVLAKHRRDDLKCAGHGGGGHGFAFTPPAGLAFAPHAIEVRRSLDGAALESSARAREAVAAGM